MGAVGSPSVRPCWGTPESNALVSRAPATGELGDAFVAEPEPEPAAEMATRTATTAAAAARTPPRRLSRVRRTAAASRARRSRRAASRRSLRVGWATVGMVSGPPGSGIGRPADASAPRELRISMSGGRGLREGALTGGPRRAREAAMRGAAGGVGAAARVRPQGGPGGGDGAGPVAPARARALPDEAREPLGADVAAGR